MIIGIGYDIVQIDRIHKALHRFEQRFLMRCFTEAEQNSCLARPHQAAQLAKRFAAKEAFVKALGTGFCPGLSWRDIEVAQYPSGQPYLQLYAGALSLLQQKLPHDTYPAVHLSLSDDYPQAGAMVVIDAINNKNTPKTYF